MLEDLQPFFRRCRFEKFADILPGLQETAGIVADAFDRFLPGGDVGQRPVQLRFFRFQPFQFRLDAGKPPRPERFQNLDQTADVGTDLGDAASGQLFFFTQSNRFVAEAGQGFLHDAIPRLDHSADVTNPADEGVFESFCRNAVGLAGVFAAFVLLAGADVVVIHGGASVRRRTDHVCPALASEQTGKQVDPPLRFLEIHPTHEHFAELELHAVELLAGDDRIVAPFLHRFAPMNLSQVDGIAKDADHLLLYEPIAAPLLIRTGAVDRIEDAEFVQATGDRTGRAEFLEGIEDASDDVSADCVNLQLAGIVGPGAITKNMATIPEAAIRPITHDREGAFGCHLPLKLGEDHDELHHRLACRHRRVELLPEAADVDIVLCEKRPQIHEVLEASRNAVELEADHEVDLAGGDVPLEPLELRAVLVLRALACIDVEFEGGDVQVLAAFAKLDFLLDLVLLRREAVALGGLALRRNPNVSRDPKRLVRWFLLSPSHVFTVLSESPTLLPTTTIELRIRLLYRFSLAAPWQFEPCGQARQQ